MEIVKKYEKDFERLYERLCELNGDWNVKTENYTRSGVTHYVVHEYYEITPERAQRVLNKKYPLKFEPFYLFIKYRYSEKDGYEWCEELEHRWMEMLK